MRNYYGLGLCYLPQPSASADDTILCLNNSSYPTRPHSIIVYCTSKNPCRVSHAMRPGLKDAV